MSKSVTAFLAALFIFPMAPSCVGAEITLELIGTYETGVFDDSALEIGTYDPGSKRLFVVNGNKPRFEIIDLSNPDLPVLIRAIDIAEIGSSANSIAFKDGILAVAIEGYERTHYGSLAFFSVDGELLNRVTIGPLPDMVAITPNGKFAVVANEGEPSADYSLDPEGSISIVPFPTNTTTISDADVKTLSFHKYNDAKSDVLRIGKPGASVAQDVEPEYVAIASDSRTAWITLQENNAVAVIDIESACITDILPLGSKNHYVNGNGLDANPDGNIDIRTWPIHGLYQPDAITALTHNGATYWLSANEGDAREYDNFVDEMPISDLNLDPATFPDAVSLQSDEQLGMLSAISNMGDTDGDGDHDIIYTFGGRSFSVWDNNGKLVYDSGDDFERITAERVPEHFNVSNDKNGPMDARSTAKGPEPEGLTIGHAFGRTLAFIGLERVGGVMIYDLSNPTAPRFAGYTNHRNFKGDPEMGTAGPLGPEGLIFISADDSPNGTPLLVVINEVSGSITVNRVVQES